MAPMAKCYHKRTIAALCSAYRDKCPLVVRGTPGVLVSDQAWFNRITLRRQERLPNEMFRRRKRPKNENILF